ncbi:MAG: glycosyltransferase [Candidatus Nealsonbacteria bacterium]
MKEKIKNKLLTTENTARETDLPPLVFLGIQIKKDALHIAELRADKIEFFDIPRRKDFESSVLEWVRINSKKRNIKYIAAGIAAKEDLENLASKLWLEEDIVPYVFHKTNAYFNRVAEKLAREVEHKFDSAKIATATIGKYNEVIVKKLVTLEDYQKFCDPVDFKNVLRLAGEFIGKRIIFISSTPQGGGVAIMRHALLRLFKLLGVDAHWYVLRGGADLFNITKTKFHNVLQGVVNKDVVLSEEDKKTYLVWMEKNAKIFSGIFKKADIIVIDDPQPSGLIPFIKKQHPGVKIIYRSHIQIEPHLIEKKQSSQQLTWEFLWKNIKLSDLFISHPISSFVPNNVPKQITAYMPPSTDPADGLNKPLTEEQARYYLKFFNKILLKNTENTLDFTRPYIIQIARFDPSKGIPDVIESYGLLIKKLKEKNYSNLPQLVICANKSIDDPDRIPIYNLVLNILNQPQYSPLRKDIIIIGLPHCDQMLNALLRKSKIALQLSHKEGYEYKVTEALMKGIPVVAYAAGGIPLQIINGVSGFLVEVGNTEKVANHMFELITDSRKYQTMSMLAVKNAKKEALTVRNAINWLYLANSILRDKNFQPNGENVEKLAGEYLSKK